MRNRKDYFDAKLDGRQVQIGASLRESGADAFMQINGGTPIWITDEELRKLRLSIDQILLHFSDGE